MKKCELVLGNVVKAYKGETEYTITNITEEVITLNNDKEVKTSTLLKNYKLIKEVEEETKTAKIELPTFQLKIAAPIIAGLLPEGKIEEKVEKVIYGIKVVKGVNQTCIWKILKRVCELKDDEGTKIAKELKEKYPEVLAGATRCLVSKKRINYINSIC